MSTNPKDAIGVKKAPLGLVPPAAIIAISDALADGATKYGPQNWRSNDGVKATIYYEAALRHLFAWVDGEDTAEDSGVHHLAHAAACLAILLDAQEIGQIIDDRPTAGAAAAMLKARDKSKAARSAVDRQGVAVDSTLKSLHAFPGEFVDDFIERLKFEAALQNRHVSGEHNGRYFEALPPSRA